MLEPEDKTTNNKAGEGKPKITPQQLQQLLAMRQQMLGQQPLTKGQILVQKLLTPVMQNMQKMIHHLDRFINFVIKRENADRNDVIQAARSPVLFGVYVIIIFVIFGGLWSAIAPLNSAAIAPGMLIPSTNKKTIQSLEGGVVKAIFVKQGDHVKEGGKLIEFEDIKAKPQYEASLSQYRILLANEARLAAERDDADSIEFPSFLTKDAHLPEVAKIMNTQETLFRSKHEVIRAEKESLKQKVAKMQKQIEGLEAKKTSLAKSLAVVKNRVKSAKSLLEKGFAKNDTVLELEAQESNYLSELAICDTDIAKARQEITRSEIDIMNLQTKNTEQTLRELKETQANLGSAKEHYLSASESVKRLVLTSPVDGIVHTVNVFTIGGVINPGYPIMEILPSNDYLVIEARVPPKNIDAVHVGLVAKIRFSAFKSRTTPLFTGKVISVSPDIVTPQSGGGGPSGEAFYNARIEIDMDEFNKVAKAKKLELYPGMQAEVQIITGTRTFLRYILDPVLDTMFKGFKEK